MKTDAQRIANYNARMLSTLVDPTIAQVVPMAVANFGAYASDFYAKQGVLRGILNGFGIPTAQYFAYEAFNGEMYHLSKVATGASAVITATALVAKYTSMFLNAAHLKTIANDVYSIVVT